MKKLLLEDLKQYNKLIDRKVLRKFGFTEMEINWAEDAGYFSNNEKK